MPATDDDAPLPGTPSAARLTIAALRTIPHVVAGDALATIIGDALDREGLTPEAGDVIVVAQKIVSKAEGRMVDLAGIEAGPAAHELAQTTGKDPRLAQLVIDESSEIMRAVPGIAIVRHRLGHVLANAGIDASNVAGNDETVLLWPVDPDASAATLRAAIEARYGVRLAIIISDSLGRAWRVGTMGTAIGVSGIDPVNDQRGDTDLFGRVLRATIIGVADEIAAAASLMIGEGSEGTPVALVRGARYPVADRAGIASLLRPIGEDLFR